jgi:hypothetical protein
VGFNGYTTFSVREACGHLDVPWWEPDDGYHPTCVVEAGDNADEFVFLAAHG